MRFFNGLNKLQTASLFPFLFCSAFIVIAEILLLIGNHISSDSAIVFENFAELLYNLLGYVFCYFITLQLTNGKNSFKAFWSVLCLAVFTTAAGAFYGNGTVYFSGIVIALLCSFLFNRFEKALALSSTMICSILFGILFGFLIDYFDNFVMWLSERVSGKGYFSPVLFSIFDTFFSLFGIDTFKEMFFYKSYGGSVMYSGEIITGVKDLFSAGYTGNLVSGYLSGHYFLLFALLGIALSLLSNLKGAQKYALIAVTVGAVLSGNISIMLLFLFFESPFLFISVLFIGALSYLSAFILNLGVGYIFNGGIAEMILYMDNAVYLLAGGMVFVAIGYFVYKLIYEKHGITDCMNIYIPARLNTFVKALGGISNIIRYKENALEVRNPKLIDTVLIDCEIKENLVISDDEKFSELKEYL